MQEPRAVFLDVGWTLTYPRDSLWTILADGASQAGKTFSAGEIEKLVFDVMQVHTQKSIAEFETGKTTYTDSDEQFRAVFQNLSLAIFRLLGIESGHDKLMDVTLQRFWELSNWAAFPDVIPAIEKLRARGIRVVALSNAGSELASFLEEMNLARHLDATVISAVEGVRKPDPLIFERALALAGTSPDETVHVGDMFLEDVLGARHVGITPYLIDRGEGGMFPSCGLPVDSTRLEGVTVVASLDDVVTLLAQ